MHDKPVWYCVISTSDLRMVYLGTGEAEAITMTRPHMYCATAATMGEAQRIAAIEAGQIKTLVRRPGA